MRGTLIFFHPLRRIAPVRSGTRRLVVHVCLRPTLGPDIARKRSHSGGISMRQTIVICASVALSTWALAACSGAGDQTGSGQIDQPARSAHAHGTDAGTSHGKGGQSHGARPCKTPAQFGSSSECIPIVAEALMMQACCAWRGRCTIGSMAHAVEQCSDGRSKPDRKSVV